jgi:hypothetical protein
MRRLALLLLACSRPIPATVADGCYELSGVICDKEAACNAGGGAGCQTAETQLCCANHDCTQPVADCAPGVRQCVAGFSVHVFWDCEDAINAMTCGEVAGGLIPRACVADAGQ